MISYDNNSVHTSLTLNNLAIATTEERDVREHKLTRMDPMQLKPNDIIAQVAYCGLNHIDISQIHSGAYVTEYPYVLGKEWSGQILHVGSDVKDLKADDWVCRIPALKLLL